MEIELNNLIDAWKVCFNSVKTNANISHQDAINYIENFKQSSPFVLDVGIYLATQQSESSEMAHFGIQLIIHAIKYKWNDYNDQVKFQIKSKMISLISGMDNAKTLYFNGPNYLKNGVSTILIELLKREWPQCWPTFLDELFSISFSDSSIEAKKIVFIILKFIAEEFIIELDTNMPGQRRKDIVTCLNANMEKITNFYMDNLQFLFNHLQQINIDPNQLESIINLTKSCLDSLNLFMNWISLNHIFSRNYLLLNILLSLLNHDKLYLESANCLISLINRKGQAAERKPLVLLFDANFLNPILNCIKKSIENEAFKSSAKYFVKILVGIGHQLCGIWTNDLPQMERPANLTSYLNSILELILFPNKVYSNEAVQLWSTIFLNENLKKDKDVIEIIANLAKMLTNSNVLFRMSSIDLSQDLDTEESDFSRFFQKYRNDLGRLINLASNIYLEPFLKESITWTMKIITETSELNDNHQSGFDSNSLIYMSWDSLVYLWNNLIQVIMKKMKQNKPELAEFKNQLKLNLIYLIESCIKLKSKNPNYSSFNLSLMSSLLQSCEFYEFEERDRLFKLILEKLFDELTYFKNESIQLQLNEKAVGSYLKFYMNVRRQTAANVLNICKNYNKDLKHMLNPLYEQVNKHIECPNSTQMEKIILIQALVYLSNQLPSFESRVTFINELISPTFKFFTSEEFQFKIKDAISFVGYIGLNDSSKQSVDIASTLTNRKQIFYHVNLLFAIVKSLDLTNDTNNQLNEQILETNLFPYLFKILDVILDLFKCFNMIHGLPQTELNPYYLNIPESAKASIAGTSQGQHAAHGPNSMHLESSIYSEDHNNSEKCLMFFYNTYETLNQLIGLYLNKFKKELILVEADQAKLNFVYKLGDALFSNLNQIPNFRVRLIIRYILRACLIDNFESYMFEKNFIVVKMNLVFLEFFLPNIFSRITDTNKYYVTIKEKDDDEPAVSIRNYAELSEQTRNQIIEENIFSIMCRDVVDLIKMIFNFRNVVVAHQPNMDENSTWNMNDNNNHDADLAMTETAKPKDVTNTSSGASHNNISELAVYLMKNSKIIYQSLILCLFEGLNWPDSYCCSRLVRCDLSVLDHCSFSQEDSASKPIDFNLNEQSTEQIFLCCLFALQTHGEDTEIANLLINLAFIIYQKLEIKHKPIFHKILLQIPNLNPKQFEDFSSFPLLMAKSNKSNDNKERLRKDLFKKLLQPIVGKSSNQLKKNEVSFRALPAYSSPNLTERKKVRYDLEKVNEMLDYNICSLFDSK